MKKVFEKTYFEYNKSRTELSLRIKGPPEQVAPVNIVSQLIAIIAEKTHENKVSIIKMKVYADWGPTLYTDYQVVMEVIPDGTAQSVSTETAKPQFVVPLSVVVSLIASAIIVLGMTLISYNAKEMVRILGIPSWVWMVGGGVALVYVLRSSSIRSMGYKAAKSTAKIGVRK